MTGGFDNPATVMWFGAWFIVGEFLVKTAASYGWCFLRQRVFL